MIILSLDTWNEIKNGNRWKVEWLIKAKNGCRSFNDYWRPFVLCLYIKDPYQYWAFGQSLSFEDVC